MDTVIEKIKTIVRLMGFPEAEVALDEEKRKIIILIDDRFVADNVISILPAFDHIVNLLLKKNGVTPHIIDLNYYRKERERIISDLARAAAKKAMITKQEVALPAMNGYERRLVHMELATHPELKTESTGSGKDRYVVIKFVS